MSDSTSKFKRISNVGAGNMGTSMAFGFAELSGFHDVHEYAKCLEASERKLFNSLSGMGSPQIQYLARSRAA